MRRELLIIAGVLVPFFVLLAVGLLVDRDRPDALAPAAAPPTTDPGAAPAPGAPATPPTAQAPAAREPSGAPALPRELAAPVTAVTPEVLRCFEDHRAHLHAPQHLEVRFTPLPDGGFGSVQVPTHANPWVSACVEDVFDEVSFVPTGAETFQPARHTFVFDPAAR
ncbi:MAG: hypothetical protein JNJ54_16270 [Myxococcaceae bacterium]|nr:hypothetical protein [Myxococcaceae bacterium]